ncbi:hypothetical protein KCU77_g12297, partial [Aureobasidium melanogenum]
MINNPIFDDQVYYGYIPSDPEPDFSLQKEIHDMTAQEKQDTLEQFAKNQTDALMEDQKRRLNDRHWRDHHHKRMIVAQERGDEYPAEEIMKQGRFSDSDDTVTVQGRSMPTQLSQNKVTVLSKLLGVSFSMPKEVKQVLLRGNLSALLRDPTHERLSKAKVPPTPIRDCAARDKSLWKPYIYILHLVTNGYRNPTMKTMRTILEFANDYVRNVRDGGPGDKPMRKIRDQNYTASIREMDKVLCIGGAKQTESGGFLLQGALTSTAFNRALADGTRELPCLYITSNSQLAGIKETIKLTTAWEKDVAEFSASFCLLDLLSPFPRALRLCTILSPIAKMALESGAVLGGTPVPGGVPVHGNVTGPTDATGKVFPTVTINQWERFISSANSEAIAVTQLTSNLRSVQREEMSNQS